MIFTPQDEHFDALKASGELPSPTGVALRVLELAQHDDATFQSISEVLKADPALAGKLLQIVNAAKFGLAKPTADIAFAISQLGLRTASQLVLGFSVVANSRRGKCKQFDYDLFWLKSLATALIAQALARHSKSSYGEGTLYTCGLLCQIGRLSLATIYPERYSDLVEKLEINDPIALTEAESLRFGIDHNAVTARLLMEWGFVDELVTATFFHEVPQNGKFEDACSVADVAKLLNVASRLADCWLAGAEEREHLMPSLIEDIEPLGLRSEQVESFLEDALQDWTQWCSLMELKSPKLIPMGDAILRCQELIPDESEPESDVLRILIVDDDPTCRRAVERNLMSDNYQIETCEKGEDALRIALQLSPHIIVTDWMMPGMDGLDFCRTLRKSELGQRIYIIMLTSVDEKDKLNQAFEAGCDDYLTKPIHVEELRARIRAASRSILFREELRREKREVQRYAEELSIGNRILEQKARTDPLTGLPNRRYCYEKLQKAWDSANRHNRALSCLMIDIDNFKNVNDTYGHAVGDAVLQQTACVLNDSIRGTDMVCRYGGEEFLVLCQNSDAIRGRLTGERLRSIVENNKIHSVAFNGNITISIGVASKSPDTSDLEGLLKCADDALYEAKRKGRNCVCWSDGPVAVASS